MCVCMWVGACACVCVCACTHPIVFLCVGACVCVQKPVNELGKSYVNIMTHHGACACVHRNL